MSARLTFPDGARIDVLVTVEDDGITVEDLRADPPLPLSGLATLAHWIEGPLDDACRIAIGRPRRPRPVPGPTTDPSAVSGPRTGGARGSGGEGHEGACGATSAGGESETDRAAQPAGGDAGPDGAGGAAARGADPVAEPAAETGERAAEAVPDPAIDPATDQTTDPATDLATAPTAEPEAAPAAEPGTEPAAAEPTVTAEPPAAPAPARTADLRPDPAATAHTGPDPAAAPNPDVPALDAAGAPADRPDAPAPAADRPTVPEGRVLWGRSADRSRAVADAYRSAQRDGRDPVEAVMSATGRGRRRALRLIAGARDAGLLSPRHHRRPG
ncbi:DUF6214 family protein [Streptomyces sp. NPDC014733]|uniref:DUF6214 family protein n=1 Tax=Streptomyces sp. NPDC014733 TaxID=3364885 RepID=UPI0037030D3F